MYIRKEQQTAKINLMCI